MSHNQTEDETSLFRICNYDGVDSNAIYNNIIDDEYTMNIL